MNINNAFPSKWLKSGDIPEGSDLVLTIKSVGMETVGQGDDAEQKPIVYFTDTDKGLVLNKTNANAIAGLYGPETAGWAGKRIALFATEVQYGSQMTLAIRVRLKAPAANGHTDTLTREQAVAALEAVGLDKDALREALVAAGSVNAAGQAVYHPERDTVIVRRLVAEYQPAPEPF